MRDQSKDRLAEILDTFDANAGAAKQIREKQESERTHFLREMKDRIDKVIRPAMEEFAEALRARGHDADVLDLERDRVDGRGPPVGIKLTVYPNGDRSEGGLHQVYPHVSFVAHPTGNSGYVHVSTIGPGRSGSSGKVADWDADTVTAEVVEEHVLNMLRKVMVGSGF